MELIKTKQTIETVDFRRTLIVITNRDTGRQRRMSFADIEDRVGDIPIPAEAPEEVRDLLVTAKNLLLYSWYYYPFSVTAALQASIAVESALKLRLNAKPLDNLSFLLKKAVKQGLITDAGFPRWVSFRKALQELHGLPKVKADLTQILIEALPRFRNTIAHGNRYLDDTGFHHLDLASEVIAQLFPPVANSKDD